MTHAWRRDRSDVQLNDPTTELYKYHHSIIWDSVIGSFQNPSIRGVFVFRVCLQSVPLMFTPSHAVRSEMTVHATQDAPALSERVVSSFALHQARTSAFGRALQLQRSVVSPTFALPIVISAPTMQQRQLEKSSQFVAYRHWHDVKRTHKRSNTIPECETGVAPLSSRCQAAAAPHLLALCGSS